MNIVMIGKNDTWGVMLSWKNLLPDNIKYFMAHPAIPYEDLSAYNRELKKSLDEADIIFAHIAIRNRGLIDNLVIHNNDINDYKKKTIIYFCGDREAKYKTIEYKNYYKDFLGYVALTPDIATILDIDYLPQPILHNAINHKYRNSKLDNQFVVWSYPELRGQAETPQEDKDDYIALGAYFNKKYDKAVEFKNKSMSFLAINQCLEKNNFHVLYDNKSGCYSNLGLLSASRGVATISSLLAKYRPKFMEFTNTYTLPFINVTNFYELKYQFEVLINNRDFVEYEGNRAGRWMQTFWNKDKHIENLYRIIKKLK